MANLREWNEAIAKHFINNSGSHPLSITEDIIKEIGTGIGVSNEQVKDFLSSMLLQETGYENKQNHPDLINSQIPEDIFENGRKMWKWYSEDQEESILSWNYPDDTIPWLSHLTVILLGSAENKYERPGNSRYPAIADYIYHFLKDSRSKTDDEISTNVHDKVLTFFGADKDTDSWWPGKKICYHHEGIDNWSKSLWVFLHTWSGDNITFRGKFIEARGYVQDAVPNHLLLRTSDRTNLLEILSSFDRSLPLHDGALKAKIEFLPRSKWSLGIQRKWSNTKKPSTYVLIEHLHYIWDAEDYQHITQNTTPNQSNNSGPTFLLAPYLFIDDSSQYSCKIEFKSVRLHHLAGVMPKINDIYKINGKDFEFSNNKLYSNHVIIDNDNDEKYFSSLGQLKVIQDDKQIGLASTLRYLLEKDKGIIITKDSNGMYGYHKEDKISGGFEFSLISRRSNRSSNLQIQIPGSNSPNKIKLTNDIEILSTSDNYSTERKRYSTKIRFEGGTKLRNNCYYYDGYESLPRARLKDGNSDNVEFFPGGLNGYLEEMPRIRKDREGIYWTFNPIVDLNQQDFKMVISWKYKGEENSATRTREFTLLQDTYGMWQEHEKDEALEEKELIEPTFSFNFKHNFLTHVYEEEIDKEQTQKTSIPMTESRKGKESKERPPRPIALGEERDSKNKPKPLPKPEKINKGGKKGKEKTSEKTDNSTVIIIMHSSLKHLIQCASCGVPLATKGHVKFNCPGCSKEIIGRCRRCRINSAHYRCKIEDCGFEGP